MCFYEQIVFACGDHRWGRFRSHCTKEYRTGETCGMKLVMDTTNNTAKCSTCVKIDTKLRRRQAEADRIHRWQSEPNRTASIERSLEIIAEIDSELRRLYEDRSRRQRTL
jgi:hypothetical protein